MDNYPNKILESKVSTSGKIKFLISWDDGSETWVSKVALTNYQDLINEFLQVNATTLEERRSYNTVKEIETLSETASLRNYSSIDDANKHVNIFKESKNGLVDDRSKRKSESKQENESKVNDFSRSRNEKVKRRLEDSDSEDISQYDDDDEFELTQAKKKKKSRILVKNLKSVPFKSLHWNKCNICGGSHKYNKIDELEGDSGSLLACLKCTASVHENCQTKAFKKKSGQNTSFVCRHCSMAEPCCHYCRMIQPPRSCEIVEEHVSKAEVFDERKVLFRCYRCGTLAHMKCLVYQYFKKVQNGDDFDGDLQKGSPDYFCKFFECVNCTVFNESVEVILTWKDMNLMRNNTISPVENEVFPTDVEREYFVKFKNLSHLHNKWVPEFWLQNIKNGHSIIVRFKKMVLQELEEAKLFHFTGKKHSVWPKSEADAVDQDWITVEKILDVDYIEGAYISTNTKKLQSEKDNSRDFLEEPDDDELEIPPVVDIDRVLVKWIGLPYESSTWEDFPVEEDDVLYDEKEIKIRSFFRNSLNLKYNTYVKSTVLAHKVPNGKKIKNFTEFKKQPYTLSGGTLKDYQLAGFNWLLYQWHKDIPSILADDMGLVAPTTTIGNWMREFSIWAPNLICVAFAGSNKAKKLIKDEVFDNKFNLKCHVVICNYDNINDDTSFFKKKTWEILCCDEGHRLKNDQAKTFQNLINIPSKHKILLTGTPLQNNIKELFNLMNFLDPHEFEDANEWIKHFGNDLNSEKLIQLHEVEILVPVGLTTLQKKLYKALLRKNFSVLKHIGAKLNQQDTEKLKATPLHNILMELRKLCGHPYLLEQIDPDNKLSDEEYKHLLIEASGKLQLLSKMLPKLKEQGHRVLIFTQFKIVLNILEEFLEMSKFEYCRLDGDTPSLARTDLIETFNSPLSSKFVFLLTTRTGGVGVNLVSADTIIIYDADWNPHQDLQAVARAHRIGQKNNVFVYKLFCKGCVEERIIDIGRKKLVLDHLIVESMDSQYIDTEEISSIIKFGAAAIFNDQNSAESNNDILKYDDDSVDKLLDRETLLKNEMELEKAQLEEEEAKFNNADAKSVRGFSFSKVWTLDSENTDEVVNKSEADKQPSEDLKQDDEFWETFLGKEANSPEKLLEEVKYLSKRKRRNINYSEALPKNQTNLKTASDDIAEDDEDEFLQEEKENSSESEDIEEFDSEDIPNTTAQTKISKYVADFLIDELSSSSFELGGKPLELITNNYANILHKVVQLSESSKFVSQSFKCWLCQGSYHCFNECVLKNNLEYLQQQLIFYENNLGAPNSQNRILIIKTLVSILRKNRQSGGDNVKRIEKEGVSSKKTIASQPQSAQPLIYKQYEKHSDQYEEFKLFREEVALLFSSSQIKILNDGLVAEKQKVNVTVIKQHILNLLNPSQLSQLGNNIESIVDIKGLRSVVRFLINPLVLQKLDYTRGVLKEYANKERSSQQKTSPFTRNFGIQNRNNFSIMEPARMSNASNTFNYPNNASSKGESVYNTYKPASASTGSLNFNAGLSPHFSHLLHNNPNMQFLSGPAYQTSQLATNYNFNTSSGSQYNTQLQNFSVKLGLQQQQQQPNNELLQTSSPILQTQVHLSQSQLAYERMNRDISISRPVAPSQDLLNHSQLPNETMKKNLQNILPSHNL
ncbi:hypothetical protein HDU92_003861 [Lobulomyces angularis]|nr:hypothetical protein HDU92_003861 [Lobulomyces angularis]